VQQALDGINAALAVHLGDEETTIVPVMETTLTQAEVDWFGEHGRKATPQGQLWNQLGSILAAQPDGGARWALCCLSCAHRALRSGSRAPLDVSGHTV